MAKIKVLVEVANSRPDPFSMHAAAIGSVNESLSQGEMLFSELSGYNLEVIPEYAPVPMFSNESVYESDIPVEGMVTNFNEYIALKENKGFSRFSTSATNSEIANESFVVPAFMEESRIDDLTARNGIKVWPNSELTLFQQEDFDIASVKAMGGIDCNMNGVPIQVIRELLGVDSLWRDGFKGQNIVVGIIDEGVNGLHYPVIGGYDKNGAYIPGSAHITSHGSMCAADVLVAAPMARFYDYAFLGRPDSGGAINMFQTALNQRRINGTPHITNNSYGFTGVPPKTPPYMNHEIHDINHPLHRKVRELVASGCITFFAAGNCGSNCPSGDCHPSGIGSSRSIHASNSLASVITIAGVTANYNRVGYSSQGPGMFENKKPDLSAYTHFFGNFGVGRPGGTPPNSPCDNGTSAATPVAAGVAALLLSANQQITPHQMKDLLIKGATQIGSVGYNYETGYGVINAAASYNHLKKMP